MMMMFDASFRPLSSKFENNLEILNEFMICQCTFLCFGFTDWISDPETSFIIGWARVCLFALVLIINVVIMIYKTFLFLKKFSSRFENKHGCLKKRLKRINKSNFMKLFYKLRKMISKEKDKSPEQQPVMNQRLNILVLDESQQSENEDDLV